MTDNLFKRKKSYFKGWYIKQTNDDTSLSFIPAFHIDDKGAKSASLQVITNDESYNLIFSYEDFLYNKEGFNIRIGENTFSENGIKVNIDTETLKIRAELTFGLFTPISYDIMGPFKYVPLMQCRHGVLSMSHLVNGIAVVNGKEIVFNDSIGYIETDKGSSFPKTYLWTQCNYLEDEHSCIMLSVADIPMMLTKFKGCLSIIYYKGQEYRLTTYLGAKIIEFGDRYATIIQKNMVLNVELLEPRPQDLRAPVKGAMTRIIYESIKCKVRYRFVIDNKVLFDFVSDKASFEYSRE